MKCCHWVLVGLCIWPAVSVVFGLFLVMIFRYIRAKEEALCRGGYDSSSE